MLTCKLCNKEFYQITDKHLKAKHNSSCKDYLIQFPGELFTDPKINAAKGKKISAIKAEQDIIAWNKGIPTTEEKKLKQSVLMKEKFASGEIVHWNTGLHHSVDTRKKISNSLMGHSYFNEEALVKRNSTIEEKVKNGWISPLRNKKLSGSHLASSVAAIIKAQEIKVENFYNRVEALLTNQNIKIVSYNSPRFNLECQKCNTIFSRMRGYFQESCRYSKLNYCPTCFPRTKIVSNLELDVLNFIKQHYPNVIHSDRTILKGKEIDILIPDKAIGFEIAGLYWHSELNYHAHKLHILHKQQFAFKQGIKLFTIFEDEWNYKQNIVKSRILNILGISSRKLHARKTIIKKIDTATKNVFLEDHHIQGLDISGIRYGAFIEDELVAVMTFANNKEGFILNRFAVKSDCTIRGIASKLLKQFIIDHNPSTIISYADRRWSSGALYKTLGFTLESTVQPSYWYLKDYTDRLYKGQFRLEKLPKKLEAFDPSLTEWENMQDHGFDRIWDAGITKWKLTL